jgi:hypothetical protein
MFWAIAPGPKEISRKSSRPGVEKEAFSFGDAGRHFERFIVMKIM